MLTDRTIGRVVKVKTYQALVELSSETSSYVKSTYTGLYAIAAINSFVIVPVGSERVVGIVTALDMAEEPEASLQNRQMLVIPRSRRTMWISMIGTITQHGTEKVFEYGIRRYPELDNPVWCADRDDLDVIFGKTTPGGSEPPPGKPKPVPIGTSPLFPDYEVTIDIDRFFGKHAAILGNTGSGKSCTVTALIKAVLNHAAGGGMPHAHFIIFDTNNEYTSAFTEAAATPHGYPTFLFDRLVLSNDGDKPTGLWVPHWFMNSSDYLAFFHPGEGAQGPLLFKAISVARAQAQSKTALIHVYAAIEGSINAIEAILSNPKIRFRGKDIIYDQEVQKLEQFSVGKEELFRRADRAGSWEGLMHSISGLVDIVRPPAAGYHALDPISDDQIRELLQALRTQMATDRIAAVEVDAAVVGIDSPVHFDFDNFVTTVFGEELEREATRNPQLRSYVGTLQLRLDQARQDPRYAFLFKVQPFAHALASFLRLLFGEFPAKHFATEGAKPPWADAYQKQYTATEHRHRVTIVDLSQLASEVLENVTALIGRLVLEFMQRCPDRGKFPVVLVLEEAHHYIAAHIVTDRQRRAREVFEKIAKEGRKFGLSLVVASQRPSELSRTVLAQCNSFIVHRIQNPDDQEYFKSVISGVNRELLDQLPALPQQHAIVLGDCVRLPLQVRITDVAPKPNSYDPEFFRVWSDPNTTPPDFETICDKWQEGID